MDIFLQLLDKTGLWAHREGLCTSTAKSVLQYVIYLEWISAYWYILAPLDSNIKV